MRIKQKYSIIDYIFISLIIIELLLLYYNVGEENSVYYDVTAISNYIGLFLFLFSINKFRTNKKIHIFRQIGFLFFMFSIFLLNKVYLFVIFYNNIPEGSIIIVDIIMKIQHFLIPNIMIFCGFILIVIFLIFKTPNLKKKEFMIIYSLGLFFGYSDILVFSILLKNFLILTF
jgi:hypothetical protein